MSELERLKESASETIYLIPMSEEGSLHYVWCDDPAPQEGMHESEAVEYVRRDKYEALAARLGRTKGEGCACQGCGRRYHDDLIVDDATWERIKPEGRAEGAGLLCGTCIYQRVVEPQAANVGRLREALHQALIHWGPHCTEEDGAAYAECEKRCDASTQSSLTQRDARLKSQWQAEALEAEVDNGDYGMFARERQEA